MRNFKMWLSILKISVASVGDLGIRGDGNFDFDFFPISTSVDDTEKFSRRCIRKHSKNDTEELSPAGLPSSIR